MNSPGVDRAAEAATDEVAIERSNASRYVWAHGLQNAGDQIIAAKTVLPWLLQVAGVPGFFIALLVPIRESGSMLPQAALTPWVKTRRRRTSVWIVGALMWALTGQLTTSVVAGLIAVASCTWLVAIVIFRGVIATWGPAAAILFLAAIGLVGVVMSTKLKDVSLAKA